jgi:hypothetical protein
VTAAGAIEVSAGHDPSSSGYSAEHTGSGPIVKRTLSIAGWLIGLAIVFAILGVVLRALRWLLIIAAVVLVIGAVVGYRGRSDTT